MLKYNHYLKKIGIKKTSYPFGTKKERFFDKRYRTNKDGFKDAETFSLDYTFALYIYSHLCYFRDNCATLGYPAHLTEEEWHNILNDMIDGFKKYIEMNKSDDLLTEDYYDDMHNKMKLFIEYFPDLWW